MWNLFSDNGGESQNKKMDNHHNDGDIIELDDSEEAGNELGEESSISDGVNAITLNINNIIFNNIDI